MNFADYFIRWNKVWYILPGLGGKRNDIKVRNDRMDDVYDQMAYTDAFLAIWRSLGLEQVLVVVNNVNTFYILSLD